MQVAGWHVEIEFDEDEHHVRAAALLRLRDGTELRAKGQSTRNPRDPNVAMIGEELAGARALADLAEQLAAKSGKEVRELHPTAA
ncbi:dsRBD fold-containing protein [Streptomyces sp. NPDC052396]|uniref:dsRBD fold-containing protein n=1 Tax=Streptomyces sp. NPDC052396 TaxID=3365689 RepID=UPI0037D7FA0D